MPRLAWKGSLKLSLISIPVRVFPATTSTADVHFRQLHRKCHTPIELRKWCPHCEQDVASDDVVRGYESRRGKYVIVEDAEIKALRPETTHVIEIVQMADASELDHTSIERIYYLTPENKAAGSPFAVVREALGNQAGIGSIALHGRDYVVAVVAHGDAIALYTLRTVGEVNEVNDISEAAFARVTVKPEEVKLAKQVLGNFKRTKDLSTLTDRYQESLKEMIAARTTEAVDAEPRAAGKKGKPDVVNLMEALRRSLAYVKDQKRPSRGATKKAKVLTHTPGRRRKAS